MPFKDMVAKYGSSGDSLALEMLVVTDGDEGSSQTYGTKQLKTLLDCSIPNLHVTIVACGSSASGQKQLADIASVGEHIDVVTYDNAADNIAAGFAEFTKARVSNPLRARES